MGDGGADLYLSRILDGRYQPPENLGDAINTAEGEDAPHLSPDGRTLLFSRNMDIFVSFRTAAGQWTEAREVAAVNTPGMETLPVLSPEGSFLFFVRDWRPYWVEAAVLREPPA